jgi:hypothetical protein
MIIDRSHVPWIVGSAFGLGLATGFYVTGSHDPLHPVSGGSAAGLTFGAAGSACMLFAAALTLRKQLKNWRLGKTSRWLAGHVWISVLALPLILFHAGFRCGGPLTTALIVLLAVSWGSGVVGLLIQHVLPRLMTEQVPRETIFEQVDHVIDLLRVEARKLIEGVAGPLEPALAGAALAGAAAASAPAAAAKAPRAGSAPLKDYFVEQVWPWLSASHPSKAAFDQPSTVMMQRAHVRRLVPADLHETVDDLFDLCEERRQIERQRRLHLWMHGWLFVHVPASWALLAAGLFHAVWALRY